ncbi:MAG: 23S rRNA pseudouridine2605 synthase [Halieaceae bacterium]
MSKSKKRDAARTGASTGDAADGKAKAKGKGKAKGADVAAPVADAKEGEKLHKVLARNGLGSRREMERWIESKRVTIDGRIAKLGDRVAQGQRIEVDGQPLEADNRAQTRCLLYHKPIGEVCSRKDPEGRKTTFERLPKVKSGRWVSIGRLDYNTSGLLLFSTDGELANGLMHPSANIEREYLVRVMGDATDEKLQAMLDGVLLEDGVARFADIQPGGGEGSNRWYYVVLMEGRNREVRRLWESQGLTVSRLKRVRYGEFFIPSKIKQGQWEEMEAKQIAALYRMAGIPLKAAEGITPQQRRQQKRMAGKRSVQGLEKPSGRAAGKAAGSPAGKATGRSARKAAAAAAAKPYGPKRRTRFDAAPDRPTGRRSGPTNKR